MTPLIEAKTTRTGISDGTGSTKQPDEWAILAGMRFFLACVVMGSHINVACVTDMEMFHKLGAQAAVLGFFMISGYSIASSLERGKEGYFMRRANRIFPLMLASLIMTMVVATILGGEVATPRGVLRFPDLYTLICNLFLLQGFAAHVTQYNAPLWSLSLEWSYYLFAPWLMTLSEKRLVRIIFASAVLSVLYQCFTPQPFVTTLYGIAAAYLLWAWLLGFTFRRFPESPVVRRMMVWLPLVTHGIRPSDDGSLMAVTLLATSNAILHGRRILLSVKVANVLKYLGEVSFPLYIAHYPVFIVLGVIGLTHDTKWINPITAGVSGFLTAIVLYHCVDAPLRKPRGKRLLATMPGSPSRFGPHHQNKTTDSTATDRSEATPRERSVV